MTLSQRFVPILIALLLITSAFVMRSVGAGAQLDPFGGVAGRVDPRFPLGAGGTLERLGQQAVECVGPGHAVMVGN